MRLNPRIVHTDQILQDAIKAALVAHDLNVAAIRICLLFGSRAKGTARPDSDVDLIFILDERSNKQFNFKRLLAHKPSIDSNVIPLQSLDHVCALDVDWAYRLYWAVPLFRFSGDQPARIKSWLRATKRLISSPSACLHRCISHVNDLKMFQDLLKDAGRECMNLGGYVFAEIFHLLPLALLAGASEVAYRTPYPAEEAWTYLSKMPRDISSAYLSLAKFAADQAPFGVTVGNRWDSIRLRVFRSSIRRRLEQIYPGIFMHGYGRVNEILRSNFKKTERYLATDATAAISISNEFYSKVDEFITSIIAFAKQSEPTPRLHKPRSTLPRHDGVRLSTYERETERLRIILPTGGCRVSTCSFCMLPQLARNKGNIEAILTQILRECSRPVKQIAIQTDGSFFDDRELSDHERNLIIEFVKRLRTQELVVDSLPHFATEDKLERLSQQLAPSRLRLSIGLQSIQRKIRRYITRTPIRPGEMERLIAIRERIPFGFRIYLLAGKCLMSRFEDGEDLLATCHALTNLINSDDIVTVNPLMPTDGTSVAFLEQSGMFEAIDAFEASRVANILLSIRWPFKLEFGPLYTSPCTNRLQMGPGFNRYPYVRDKNIGSFNVHLGAGSLPWTVLGDMRQRYLWWMSLKGQQLDKASGADGLDSKMTD